jgi:hypothetical protein
LIIGHGRVYAHYSDINAAAAERLMIFTYTTIFFASLLVAMVALLIYKVVSRSSESIHDSKARKAELNQNRVYHKAKGNRTVIYDTPPSLNWRERATPRDLTRAHPAMAAIERHKNDVWPYREKKPGSVGSSYKVKRKGSSGKQSAGDASKPWGW